MPERTITGPLRKEVIDAVCDDSNFDIEEHSSFPFKGFSAFDYEYKGTWYSFSWYVDDGLEDAEVTVEET